MPASLEDLLSHLDSVVRQLRRLKEADDIDIENLDLAWELLATIEDLFLQVFDD